MNTTPKDRYEHKLRKFLKEIDSFKGDVDSFLKHRSEVMKKYGFTEDDWHKACRLSRSVPERKFYRDNVGIKKEPLNSKEKSDKKLEQDMMSGKQQFFDEDGDAAIKYEDAWIADVFEPNDYDESFLAKEVQ